RLPRGQGCAGASRVLLRLPARVLPCCQPAAARRRVCGRREARAAAHRDPVSPRRSGLLIPLFSAPGERSWGIGDIGDLRHLTSWLAGGGQRVLQLLPVGEMAPTEQSPYSAISAMAIDPIYIDMAANLDFAAIGGEGALPPADQAELE